MTKLDWNDFQWKFHESWHRKIKPFFSEGGFDPIYDFLKSEAKRGKKIAPLSSDTFKCFKETAFDEVMLILVGMAPYHSFRNGKPVADGLLMSCSVNNYLQPSLENWYKALEHDYYNGVCASCVKNPDLTFMAHQDVLLLNAALTTEENKPGNHAALWESFMKYLFEEVFDTLHVPIVFLGQEAAKLEKYVAPFTWTFKISHPASAAYKGIDWDSEGMFKTIDKILIDNHGISIQWFDTD